MPYTIVRGIVISSFTLYLVPVKYSSYDFQCFLLTVSMEVSIALSNALYET